MSPIGTWWFALDLPTQRAIKTNPRLPLTADLVGRIQDAGGIILESHLLTGTSHPCYEILPDDIHWIDQLDTPTSRHGHSDTDGRWQRNHHRT